MAVPKALLLSASTGVHFGVIPTLEFQLTHGILTVDKGAIQHHLNLMDWVTKIDLPDLEEVAFSDFRFKLLKTRLETEEDMVQVFGTAEVVLRTTAFGHSLAATIIPEPAPEFVGANVLPPELTRVDMPADGGMYFSGEAGRDLPPWESFDLDRES